MTYRPQFVFPPAPAGFQDEEFDYSFDGTTVPLLNASNAIAAGGQSNDILLPLDHDAIFICRAIKIQLGTAASTLYVQLRTPHGDYISTIYVPLALWAGGTDGIVGPGQLFVPLPDEIEGPPGGVWTLFLYNPTGGTVNPPAVTLKGVKRWDCSKRRDAA